MDIKEETSIQGLKNRGRKIPLDEAQRRDWASNFNLQAAMQTFGTRLDLSDDTLITVCLDKIGPHHLGGMGSDYVNGAVIAGVFDASLGVAGALQYLGKPAGTVELSLKFLRAIHGPTVTAYAIALKRADSVCFVEGRVFSQGRLCALATGLVAVAKVTQGAKELRW